MLTVKFTKQVGMASTFILTLTLTLLLVACGDTNTPAVPAPTTVAQTAVPDKASRFSQLINYLPDTGELPKLVYNDFATTFKLYGITPDSYISSPPDPYIKLKDVESPSLLLSALGMLSPSGASNFTARNDQVKAFGWSRFQVSAEIYTSLVFNVPSPATLSAATTPVNGTVGLEKEAFVLHGQFDPKAIDTALTAKGYQKQTMGADALYSLGQDGKTDPRIQIYEFRIGLNNIGVLADGSAIVTSAYKEPAVSSLELLGAKNPTKTLAQNPAVKAFADLYAPVQMISLFDIHPDKDIDNLGKYDFRNLHDQKLDKARKWSKELPNFPAARMGGVAYYEPKRGERYIWLATYYDSADKAKQALPALERLLKEGYPYNTGAFYGGADYNSYLTLTEAVQKDNILSFKLKLANSIVLFDPASETNYPLGLYKE